MNNKSARQAREAVADAGQTQAPATAPAGAEADKPPANAHWRASQGELRARLGDQPWRAWLLGAIVASDDGEGLVLWLPSEFIVDYVRRQLGDQVEAALGRRIEFVCKPSRLPSAAFRDERARVLAMLGLPDEAEDTQKAC